MGAALYQKLDAASAEAFNLHQDNIRLRAALKWYAKPDHWKRTGEGHGPNPALDDAGKLARAALEK